MTDITATEAIKDAEIDTLRRRLRTLQDELDRRETLRVPPSDAPDEETGKQQESYALFQAYSAACTAKDHSERVLMYLHGRVEGQQVDLAQHQSQLDRIESALATVVGEVRMLRGEMQMALATFQELGTELGELKRSHVRNHPNISLLPMAGKDGA